MTTDQKYYFHLLQATSDLICLLILYMLFTPLVINIVTQYGAGAGAEGCIYKSTVYFCLLPLFVLIPPGLSLKLKCYDHNLNHNLVLLFLQPFCLTILASLFFIVFFLYAGLYQPTITTVVLPSACILFFLLALNRQYLLNVIKKSQSNENLIKHILIIGTGPKAQAFASYIQQNPESGMRFAGFLEDSASDGEKPEQPVIGQVSELQKLVQKHYVDCILLPEGSDFSPDYDFLFKTCSLMGIDFATTGTKPRPGTIKAARIQKEIINNVNVTLFKFVNITPFSAFIKRVFDFTGSTVLIFLCIPLWIVVPLLIKSSSHGPVFFRQNRVGKFGKNFTLYKFRSMHEHAEKMQASLMHLNEMDGPAFKIKEDPRQTSTGKILRKYSLDELPQLFNVFRGDISLVGPRPAKAEEVIQYRPQERKRLAVTQGITCIWQVSGRNDIKFDEWMKLDLMYIDNWSSVQDFKILFKTIPAVLMKKGAY